MSLAGGGGGGRTGPYWRRQLGTTLPGERTGPQLNAINALRVAVGLEPLGGPTVHHAAPAQAPVPFLPPSMPVQAQPALTAPQRPVAQVRTPTPARPQARPQPEVPVLAALLAHALMNARQTRRPARRATRAAY